VAFPSPASQLRGTHVELSGRDPRVAPVTVGSRWRISPLPTILPIEGAARRMLFSIERLILACRETGHSPVGRIDRAGGPLVVAIAEACNTRPVAAPLRAADA
jgi:hypothetical protein